ncbi:phage baseplate assembly protein V [Salmonella enterica]|nr:phage baseplate assembly protein V [Salmonella enterica]
MMAPFMRRVRLMLGRAVVNVVNDALKAQNVQISMLEDEEPDDVERLLNYGQISVPLPGSEAIVACIGAQRDHAVALVVEDRRYRPTGLTAGDTGVYHYEGHRMRLTKDGRLIITCKTVEIYADESMTVDTPKTIYTGDVEIQKGLNVTPMANVLPDAVATKGITGGADIESAGELLARLEYRVQYPPFGGNQYDYVRWAREVPGVTRAWCLPTWKGGGTVGVTFVQDNNDDIFPTESDVTRVDDYISGHPDPVTGLIVGKPDGIIVTTFALTRKPVDMEIYISPNTEAMQKAVRQSLTALFYNEASPGGAMAPSHIIRSVAGVTGLNDFDVRKPLDIQYSAATELLVPGVITWK